MYSRQDIIRVIGDAACVARGQSYVREGRVGRVTCTAGKVWRYDADIRGHGETYRVTFGYDLRSERFAGCS